MPLGTPVTNALGWHGTVVRRPARWRKYQSLALNDGTTSKQGSVVYVKWRERADHMGGDVVSHRLNELTVIAK